jgi:hypothetical protein
MQPRFDAVFRVWGRTRFDPQVAGIVRVPANFEWHEMVVLNVFQRTGVPVCRRVLALFDLGNGSRRPDGLGVASPANRRVERVLGDLRADRTRGAIRVGGREPAITARPPTGRPSYLAWLRLLPAPGRVGSGFESAMRPSSSFIGRLWLRGNEN